MKASARADRAQMAVGTYVRAATMRHRVVVVNGLPEITRELKGIGRNLNQLTVLANMGRIAEVNLGEATASGALQQGAGVSTAGGALMATVTFIKSDDHEDEQTWQQTM